MGLFVRRKIDPIFGLLSRQSEQLIVAAKQLEKVIASSAEERAEHNKKMHDIEHEADDACHEVLNVVNRSFMLPFDREDVYRLSGHMDNCVDYIDEASDNLVLYEPAGLPKNIDQLVKIIIECAQLTHQQMNHLSKIDERTHQYCVKINDLENEGDKLYRSMIAGIFSDAEDAVEVLKQKLVIDSLEEAIDAFESLSNVIESIAIKES
ncbi:MAG: DUF47 family protein [Actinomycetaceae bacterium]|nr:DUF47 family protein [Actinomycetaceae bacterium]